MSNFSSPISNLAAQAVDPLVLSANRGVAVSQISNAYVTRSSDIAQTIHFLLGALLLWVTHLVETRYSFKVKIAPSIDTQKCPTLVDSLRESCFMLAGRHIVLALYHFYVATGIGRKMKVVLFGAVSRLFLHLRIIFISKYS